MNCPHCGEKIDKPFRPENPPEKIYIRVRRKKNGFKRKENYCPNRLRFFECLESVWATLFDAYTDMSCRKEDFYYECKLLNGDEIKTLMRKPEHQRKIKIDYDNGVIG